MELIWESGFKMIIPFGKCLAGIIHEDQRPTTIIIDPYEFRASIGTLELVGYLNHVIESLKVPYERRDIVITVGRRV